MNAKGDIAKAEAKLSSANDAARKSLCGASTRVSAC